MARFAASGGKRLQDFESAEAPQRPIEDPAFGDRIDMRAEKNDREAGLRPGAPSVNISRGVDPDIEPGLSHFGDEPSPRALVGLGEPEAGDSAFGPSPEGGDLGEKAFQPFGIDMIIGRVNLTDLLGSLIFAH